MPQCRARRRRDPRRFDQRTDEIFDITPPVFNSGRMRTYSSGLKCYLEDDQRQKATRMRIFIQLPAWCSSQLTPIHGRQRLCASFAPSYRASCIDGGTSWQCRPGGSIAPPRWSAENALMRQDHCIKYHIDLIRAHIQRFHNILESPFSLHWRTHSTWKAQWFFTSAFYTVIFYDDCISLYIELTVGGK